MSFQFILEQLNLQYVTFQISQFSKIIECFYFDSVLTYRKRSFWFWIDCYSFKRIRISKLYLNTKNFFNNLNLSKIKIKFFYLIYKSEITIVKCIWCLKFFLSKTCQNNNKIVGNYKLENLLILLYFSICKQRWKRAGNLNFLSDW